MVAPLIPFLARAFATSEQVVGYLVPAYTLPYAAGALVVGVLTDRVGRRVVLFGSMLGFAVCSVAMALAPSMGALIALRAVSGGLNVGIAVISLSLAGDLFGEEERGRAIGWIFGAIAGGGALGSTLGGLLAPVVGWRGLFVITGAAGTGLFLYALRLSPALKAVQAARSGGQGSVGLARDYVHILSTWRAQRTYAYIFLNGVFHSGVFTWLGAYLVERYGLGEVGIGLALLGYGVPGFLCGPLIGAVVDRQGRSRMIPLGMAVAALTAGVLALRVPLWVAAMAITVLSLGFDMSHPLLAGLATMLDPARRGRAMGLNTFSLFAGFGCGSLLFGWLARAGMGPAMGWFAAGQVGLAVVAVGVFAGERSKLKTQKAKLKTLGERGG